MTAFSDDNFSFSQRAHIAAEADFYPLLWPHSEVRFIDTTKTEADLSYAVDCVAEVSLPFDPKARAPVRFYIQERWRRSNAMSFRDVTITEWNLTTNQPSELHKFGAQLFVYGYFNDKTGKILAARAIDVMRLIHSHVNGEMEFSRARRFDQDFIGVKWDEVDRIGATIFALEASQRFETMTDWRDG